MFWKALSGDDAEGKEDEEYDGGSVAAGIEPAGEPLSRVAEVAGEVPPCGTFCILPGLGGVSSVTPPPAGGDTPVAGLPDIDPLEPGIVGELVENEDASPTLSSAGDVFAGAIGPLDAVPVNCGAGEFMPGICTVGGDGNAWAVAGADSGF